MDKSLQDYKNETRPKTETQIIQELKSTKYRAIEALYIGLFCIVFFITLSLTNTNIAGIKINNFDDYIALRKTFIWASLIERVFWACIIAYFANRLNRLPLPWIIFAFFTPYLALIVIGLTPKKDNNFYEYDSSSNKIDFFNSLTLTEKLKLYRHLLIRAQNSPIWFDKINILSGLLFANETTALETLKAYEELYHKNLLRVLLAKMPNSQNDRDQYFKAIEDLGLIETSSYKNKEAEMLNKGL